MPLLKLRNATLGYGHRAVLRGVDLSVSAGDFIVIGGPNGGGKSTLLRTLANLLSPLDGSVERRCHIGYVPQQSSVNHPLPLTGVELVELGASCRTPWWRTLITPRSSFHVQALRACQAESFAHQPLDTLSGGQRQRILLARAIASGPDCLLLDEPTAGVDPATQSTLARLLAGLRDTSGLAIVLVTHEADPFLPSATRLLHVRDGCVTTQTPS